MTLPPAATVERRACPTEILDMRDRLIRVEMRLEALRATLLAHADDETRSLNALQKQIWFMLAAMGTVATSAIAWLLTH